MTTEERIETFKDLCGKMNFELKPEFENWLCNNSFFLPFKFSICF